jgi:uncharacterized damage-inducible protein DinB
METTQAIETTVQIISPEDFLEQWLGHRRLTKKLIEIFPEDQLFNHTIGGMRPFADMAKEALGIAGIGIKALITGYWQFTPELDYNPERSIVKTKEELLRLWDEVTEDILAYWPQITPQQFREKVLAFGMYEAPIYNMIWYWIDNEIHHRGQGYVYLRSLGIEPPAFWDRS